MIHDVYVSLGDMSCYRNRGISVASWTESDSSGKFPHHPDRGRSIKQGVEFQPVFHFTPDVTPHTAACSCVLNFFFLCV